MTVKAVFFIIYINYLSGVEPMRNSILIEGNMQNYVLPSKTFSAGEKNYSKIKVYYISDIHLLHQLGEAGEKYIALKQAKIWDEVIWEKIKIKIDNIVKKLFTKKLQEDILSSEEVLLIFIGDISSDTKITHYFYHKVKIRYMYIKYMAWKEINHYVAPVGEQEAEQIYNSTLRKLQSSYEAEFGKLKKYYTKLKNWKSLSQEQILGKLETRGGIPFFEYRKRKIKELMFQVNWMNSPKTKEDFIKKKVSGVKFTKRKKYPIYAVLGNHELIDFTTVQEAVDAYKEFFSNEGMYFLHNSGYVFEILGTKCFILGGIGFAKYNQKYNANTLVTTTPPMSREEEIKESEECFDLYQDALEARENCYGFLIFVTHYPVSDWMPTKNPNGICTFFTGHNHRNQFKSTDTIQIYADNQIGYSPKDIKFKSCCLGCIYNPFITYKDGYYVISTEQYKQFMKFCGESIQGTYNIERQITEFNAKFYMVKRKNYYGFFVINEKTGAKICEGGRIRNISQHIDIEYFYNNFIKVVENYIQILAPFRKVQEAIAGEVKRLGFSGEIHGLIIDLGFKGEAIPDNHIMINPYDGKITIYYSPVFGVVKEYRSFSNFIEEWASSNVGEEQYRQIKDQYQKMEVEKSLITLDNKSIEDKMADFIMLDIKNSLYSESAKIRQLERLFTSNVLRDWNEEWIHSNEILLTGNCIEGNK